MRKISKYDISPEIGITKENTYYYDSDRTMLQIAVEKHRFNEKLMHKNLILKFEKYKYSFQQK